VAQPLPPSKDKLTKVALAGVVAALAVIATGSAHEAPGFNPRLEALRQSGDVSAQRAHVWQVFQRLTQTVTVDGQARPAFDGWRGEDDAFAASSVSAGARGIRAFARNEEQAGGHGGFESAPLLSYTLYNGAAFDHLQANRLYQTVMLDRLRAGPASNEAVEGDRSIPAFPADAMILKTAWWPAAHDRATPVPVWDPQANAATPIGNPYTSWKRVVVVSQAARAPRTQTIGFAGRRFTNAPTVALDAFYSVPVDAGLAARLMREREASKLAWLVLGRPWEAGDRMLFVGANLATKETADWVWGTVWWHDRPGAGAFAAGRPASLTGPWRNYLLQASFDSETPLASDGGPNITFNPWLEGRFPDGGQGGGSVSNCMACHRRASYPAVPFLPVTRGTPDAKTDAAYRSGRLRTGFIWAIAMHGRPLPQPKPPESQ
jgi:hypothetical protein